MARKSKAFKQLYQTQKRHKWKRPTGGDRLRERVVKELGISRDRIVSNPPGQAKMSKIFMDFVRPYLDRVEDEEDCRDLFDLAFIVWNEAVLSSGDLSRVYESLFEGEKETKAFLEWKSETMELMESMLQRKLEHFPDCKRQILDFVLEDRGDDYYISIISSPELDPSEEEE